MALIGQNHIFIFNLSELCIKFFSNLLDLDVNTAIYQLILVFSSSCVPLNQSVMILPQPSNHRVLNTDEVRDLSKILSHILALKYEPHSQLKRVLVELLKYLILNSILSLCAIIEHLFVLDHHLQGCFLNEIHLKQRLCVLLFQPHFLIASNVLGHNLDVIRQLPNILFKYFFNRLVSILINQITEPDTNYIRFYNLTILHQLILYKQDLVDVTQIKLLNEVRC